MPETTENNSYLRRNYRDVPFWNPTQRLPGDEGLRTVRMDLNECPHPPSPKAVAAMQAVAGSVNRYPDATCPELTSRIANRAGVDADRICWGTGSSQLLTNIAAIAVAPGERIVAHKPLWRRFGGVFRMADADVDWIGCRPDLGVDVDALTGAIEDRTRLAVCVTPNNPTGMMLSAAEIEAVVDGCPDHVLLFIDEAYYEFARHAGGPDALEFVRRRKGPWVVTRTFSKAYALAGLRIGYAICSSPEIVNALRLATAPSTWARSARPRRWRRLTIPITRLSFWRATRSSAAG